MVTLLGSFAMLPEAGTAYKRQVVGWKIKSWCSSRVQQLHRTATTPFDRQKTSDLLHRPLSTSVRLVCIQKARGSSPLSSTGQRPLAILKASEQSQTKSQSRRKSDI